MDGFLVMTVLALGVTIIYNYDRMKQVEQSLAILSDHVDSQREYVTDRAEPAESVISHMQETTEEAWTEMAGDTEKTEKTEVTETNNMIVEEETLTGTPISTQPETEQQVPTMAESKARASYTVKVGDTLAGISEMYYGNTEKVQEICSLNGISEEDTILPGQKILLP